MTKVGAEEAEPAASPGANRTSGVPLLPLVSVVIVNFNYGRYVAEAVDSVFQQTYGSIECIVVDNGSTDESDAVLFACQSRHPTLQVFRRATNSGQTQACIEGFQRSRGPYVVFLDADDFLLPHCIATHIAVHLSSTVHVGFTSGDMVQVADGQMVLGTGEAIATFRREKTPERTDLLRPSAIAHQFLQLGGLHELASAMSNHVQLVPRKHKIWSWAPTSRNCFRRDALQLFLDTPGLPALTSQTDLFLVLGINAVCGSLLIEEPLFAYRLHGSNVFSSRPQLNGLLNFDVKRGSHQAALARRLIIDQLSGHVARFVQEPWMKWHLFTILRLLDSRISAGDWRGSSYAGRAVASNFTAVAAAVGWPAAMQFVLARLSWFRKLKMMLNARAFENDAQPGSG